MNSQTAAARRRATTENRHTQTDPDDRRRASLTLAEHATNRAELLQWLDMLGLPPCERALRSATKWKAKQ